MRSLLYILFTFLIFGCGKMSVDDIDPVIEVFLLNGQNELNSINAGETLNIELVISDDEQLEEVVIRIQNNSNPALSQSAKLLHFSSFDDIDSRHFSEIVQVPISSSELTGTYEVLLQVVDANGNADTRNTSIVLLNSEEQPQVEVSGFTPPAIDGVIYMNPGDSLIVDGWIIDNTGLDQFTVSLSGPQNLHNQNVNIEEPDFLSYGFQYLGNPMVPWEVMLGEYSFNVQVTDVDGHMTFYEHPVVVE